MAVKVVSDGPIYHLYFAARWWKAGRLILIAAPFGENAATYFPANGDLWFTWLITSWGGETLAKVGQAPFLLFAGAGAYGCARSVGVGRPASLIATFWFVSESLLFLYSVEPNVNTIFVAGYLVAAYFFLQGVRGEGQTSALVLGALAAGAAIGTKAVGIVFVPPLIVLALAAIGFQAVPSRVRVLRMAVVALVPAVTGGYWFVRNAMLTGNPLYPLDVRVMGHTLWPGWYGPDAMRTSHYYLAVGDCVRGSRTSCSACSTLGWRRSGWPRWPVRGRGESAQWQVASGKWQVKRNAMTCNRPLTTGHAVWSPSLAV